MTTGTKRLERFSFACTVFTDHRQATTEADWYEPIHWYATRSSGPLCREILLAVGGAGSRGQLLGTTFC
jgi:hypothetical protein